MKKSNRQIVFNKYGGRCAYCGCELGDKWQVDHGISKCYWFFYDTANPKAVDCIDNLYPACTVCNHYKREHCIESVGSHRGFRDYMLTFHKRLAKLPKRTIVERTEKRKAYMLRIASAYNITPDKPFTGVFYFETINSIK